MNSGDLVSGNHDRSEPADAEVQFALIIARMIDTVRNSPEDMRQAIYDLARYKLQEQFTYADAKDIGRTQQALEAAIRGVEVFSRQHASIPTAVPPPPPPGISDPDVAATASRRLPPPEWIHQVRKRSRFAIDPEPNDGGLKSAQVPRPHLRRAAATIVILVGLLVVFEQRERLLSLARSLLTFEKQAAIEPRSAPAQAPNDPAPLAPQPPPAKSSPLRPTDYGVYAISDDSLTELQLLPGRPPDIRVAVSAALTVSSRTLLPNGHPKFIVFRRDVASSISDRAEVRIVAKITREFSADVVGKKPAGGEDAWVIRNVAFPFRSSPVNDNPDMYELHSEDPSLELTPGRYVLVLKNQAYDFSVEGETVDPRQCIERIIASNGTYYSDCKKP
jgi:hypothetical protein